MMLSNYRRKRLDALIEDYAAARAWSHWEDDQGSGKAVVDARIAVNTAKLALMVMLDKITKEEE